VHFTLVFPVDMTPSVLEAELQAVVAATPLIPLAIRRAEVVRDTVDGWTHLFLVPDEGRAEIEALHDRLYAGSLGPHLRPDIPYVPHMTIGVAPDVSSGERLANELRIGPRVVRGTVLSIDLIDVGRPLVRTVRTYTLGIAGEK
jgi:hypothetical protein